MYITKDILGTMRKYVPNGKGGLANTFLFNFAVLIGGIDQVGLTEFIFVRLGVLIFGSRSGVTRSQQSGGENLLRSHEGRNAGHNDFTNWSFRGALDFLLLDLK